MVTAITAALGFLGATLIGIALTASPNRPRTIALVGTILTGVACLLFTLIALGAIDG